MHTLGDFLKQARIKKGLSLDDASSKTKIRIEYLNALETGEYSEFVSEVYIKGFLKNYSKFLGLDNEYSQALFRREQKKSNDPEVQSIAKEFKDPIFTITPIKIIVCALIFATILLISYVSSQLSKLSQLPKLSLTSPIEATEENTEKIVETANNSISIEGKTEIGNTVLINNQKVALNTLAEFKIQNYQLNTGTNTISIIAVNQLSKQSEIKLIVFYQQKQTTSMSSTSSGSMSSNNSLAITKIIPRIEILENTNLEIISDGISKFKGSSLKGKIFADSQISVLKINAQSTFTVSTNEPEKLIVFINNVKQTLKLGSNTWKISNGSLEKTN